MCVYMCVYEYMYMYMYMREGKGLLELSEGDVEGWGIRVEHVPHILYSTRPLRRFDLPAS